MKIISYFPLSMVDLTVRLVFSLLLILFLILTLLDQREEFLIGQGA